MSVQFTDIYLKFIYDIVDHNELVLPKYENERRLQSGFCYISSTSGLVICLAVLRVPITY